MRRITRSQKNKVEKVESKKKQTVEVCDKGVVSEEAVDVGGKGMVGEEVQLAAKVKQAVDVGDKGVVSEEVEVAAEVKQAVDVVEVKVKSDEAVVLRGEEVVVKEPTKRKTIREGEVQKKKRKVEEEEVAEADDQEGGKVEWLGLALTSKEESSSEEESNDDDLKMRLKKYLKRKKRREEEEWNLGRKLKNWQDLFQGMVNGEPEAVELMQRDPLQMTCFSFTHDQLTCSKIWRRTPNCYTLPSC